MSGLSFTKLFKSILDSTLWVQHGNHIKVTWITMMAMADADGFVAASIPGLAKRAGVTVAECEEALAIFLAPDKYSRTPDHEGRRIREIKGGWELLTYVKHRKTMAAEVHRENKREYMRRYRAEHSESDSILPSELQVPDRGESGNVTSISYSSSGSSDPDPEQAPIQPKPAPPPSKPGAIFAPADLEMTEEQRVRCQALRFDPAQILRDFKLQEFNRAYTDWPRRLSKWIEQERINRETERARQLIAGRKHPPNGGTRKPISAEEALKQCP